MSTMTAVATLPDRLSAVRQRVDAAARRAGRDAAEITVVAVSKDVDADAVALARAAGQTDFGEGRAQELRRKADALDATVRWHFVGRLQRNKVADVVGRAALVHSVDRLAVAEALAARARAHGMVQRVLVQVNAGDDPAKAGCDPHGAGDLVARLDALDGVVCEGLMTVPALGVDSRPAFARLRRLRDELRAAFPALRQLSMGMSADFEVAVEEGATIVRIGTAVFGPRPRPAQP